MIPATYLGHMNQKMQNIQSTSKEIKLYLEDAEVTPKVTGEKTHFVFSVFIDQGQLYMDITRKFPVRYTKINSCVMFCYFYN